ncbi:hypothetical protein OJF2_28500 [Aquisphaera giovannonii]|uniref:Lipoprotein n=1 Tax=Aquisphaera giovannonii TaxID=406548 RepID=A0A5B9W249_9BACT|nr:hypothetical protein [Aquisphaera giovannonii]QEH34314.1 hypothetical protein OJF2_28500 [Aquisphaera giovannonii]
MPKTSRACLASLGLLAFLAFPGCGGSSIEEGVPKDTGFVPVMEQPGTMSMKSKPILNAKPKAPSDNPAPAK